MKIILRLLIIFLIVMIVLSITGIIIYFIKHRGGGSPTPTPTPTGQFDVNMAKTLFNNMPKNFESSNDYACGSIVYGDDGCPYDCKGKGGCPKNTDMCDPGESCGCKLAHTTCPKKAPKCVGDANGGYNFSTCFYQ